MLCEFKVLCCCYDTTLALVRTKLTKICCIKRDEFVSISKKSVMFFAKLLKKQVEEVKLQIHTRSGKAEE